MQDCFNMRSTKIDMGNLTLSRALRGAFFAFGGIIVA